MKLSFGMRAIALILITSILIGFSAFRIVYLFVIRNAKADATFTISRHTANTQLMAVNLQEYKSLAWRERGKEFQIRGQLYDIVSMSKTGNKYVLKVYADKDETRWVNELKNYLHGVFSTDGNNKHSESFFFALQKEYPPVSALKLTCISASRELYFAQSGNITPSSFIKPVWHPPAGC